MPTLTYEYAVRDRAGKVVTGRIEADSEAAVAGKLRGMGYAPLRIGEVKTSGLNTSIKLGGGRKKVKLKDLAVFSRQFSTMINSGLSLLRALSILEEQTPNPELARVVGQVRQDVETGTALSVAMANHPKVFPKLMINMTRAGEVGGFLDSVLLKIADNFEKEVRLRSKVKSALTYPVVIFVFAVLAMTGMLLFIVPVFKDMFASLGGELPLPTQMLVTLSELLRSSFPLLVVLGIVGAVVWKRTKDKPKVRSFVDRAKLKAPVFGPLVQKLALSRFTRNLGTMLHAGVPILQSLDIVAGTSGNTVVAEAVADVQDSVRRGESLAKPLEQHPIFPPMVVQMMAVGEDTGALDTMLHKISDFYDQEVEATTEALTSLIEPLMIAVVGGMVGAMIIALYMPIFKVFDLVQ